MQAYSDPDREEDPYSLPDIEVWEDRIATVICPKCGEFDVPYSRAYAGPHAECPSCERYDETVDRRYSETKTAWWYWYCFPGCLPDSDPVGPFSTEDEALADAHDNA